MSSPLVNENVIAMIQRESAVWRDHNFPQKMPLIDHAAEATLGVVEEVGELDEACVLMGKAGGQLAHSVLKMKQGIRTNEPHLDNAADALGDMFIYMCDVASRLGLSLSDCITQTWDQVKTRDWIKYPETGRPLEHHYPEH